MTGCQRRMSWLISFKASFKRIGILQQPKFYQNFTLIQQIICLLQSCRWMILSNEERILMMPVYTYTSYVLWNQYCNSLREIKNHIQDSVWSDLSFMTQRWWRCPMFCHFTTLWYWQPINLCTKQVFLLKRMQVLMRVEIHKWTTKIYAFW